MSDTTVLEGKTHKKAYRATLTAWCNQAWAAPAAFALLREQAILCGLDDNDGVYITVTLHAGGHAYPSQIAELKARVKTLGLGEVEDVQEHEIRNG
jgi:hypothetical protein